MKLSIITLNYNKPLLTILCLSSVYAIYKKKFESGDMELLIVDNKSEDNSLTLLKKEISQKRYKNVFLLANTTNAGFGVGNNVGAKKAKGEYLLFLNNDTQVKDQGLWKMAAYLDDHPHVAILGGQLRNSDGSLQASVGAYYNLFRATMLLLGFQRFGFLDRSPRRIEKVDWVKGGLLLIRKNLFEKLHGFDENIFMYTEDMELCFRAKQMGFSSYFYPNVLVFHAEHGSTNRSFAIIHIYQGLLYFYKKHKTKQELFLLQLLLKTKAVLLIALGKIIGNNYLVSTYEKALAVVRQ